MYGSLPCFFTTKYSTWSCLHFCYHIETTQPEDTASIPVIARQGICYTINTTFEYTPQKHKVAPFDFYLTYIWRFINVLKKIVVLQLYLRKNWYIKNIDHVFEFCWYMMEEPRSLPNVIAKPPFALLNSLIVELFYWNCHACFSFF